MKNNSNQSRPLSPVCSTECAKKMQIPVPLVSGPMSSSPQNNNSRPVTPVSIHRNLRFAMSPSRTNNSRPVTPVSTHQNLKHAMSPSTAQIQQVSNNPEVKTPQKIKIISSSAVHQVNSAREILASLTNLHEKLNKVNNNQNIILQHMERYDHGLQRLANIEQILGAIQAAKTSVQVRKPRFVPFNTYDELKLYDKASPEEQEEMKNWLLFHNRRTNILENTREILQQNRLISEDLLTKLVWIGNRTKKEEKFTLYSRRLTYDLSRSLLDMYPNSTEADIKNSIQKALKAANSRVYMRSKYSDHSEGPRAKKRSVSFLSSSWIPSDDNPEEDTSNDNPVDRRDESINDIAE